MAENARELGLDYEPEQEPVAWNAGIPSLYPKMKEGETISVEYVELTPLHLTWVGLTDDEIEHAFKTNSVMVDNGNAYMVAGLRAVNIAQAIEAKVKEKNE
jgi:hypothetical protein